MRLVKRILKHIRCTADYGIVFKPGPIELVCYVDSSHNTYPDGYGHYGYTFSLGDGDGVFHAVSKKMQLITLSSTESEYVASAEQSSMMSTSTSYSGNAGIRCSTSRIVASAW